MANSEVAGFALSALIVSSALGLFGCGGDPVNRPEGLLTISGIILETGNVPASGVRVTLYGTTYSSAEPTGTDGHYSIQVPGGTRLLLLTDDFDPGSDDWFQVLHCDVPTVKVDDLSATERADWPLSCVSTQSRPLALWDDYLRYSDFSNGDIFRVSSLADAGGIITMPFATCNSGTVVALDSMSASASPLSHPLAYFRGAYSDPFPPLGSDCFYPATRTVTDASGLAVSFGDSAAPDTMVTITVSDHKTARHLAWEPFECPVRRGMISSVRYFAINGVAGKHTRETFVCGGLLPGPSAGFQAATRPGSR